MKKLILTLSLFAALIPGLARAEDFTGQNRGLPATFKRVESQQTYFCAVVKISLADERVRDHIGKEFSLDDIGSYNVLNEVHVGLAGGMGAPRFLKKGVMSYLEAVEQLETNPDCGAGLRELTDAEWKAELDQVFSESNG